MIGRGHLWWTRLDKIRPAVIVSSDDICDLPFWQIHVAHITSERWHQDFPSSIPIAHHAGLPSDRCYVSVLETQLIERELLVEHIGPLARPELASVDAALRNVFGLH